MDDSATQQSPWVPPSTARSVTIPVWTSELDESTTSTKKTKPHWEKKVSKHVRNYQVKGRPSFAVHKKKAVWDEWKTDREIPEGRDHPVWHHLPPSLLHHRCMPITPSSPIIHDVHYRTTVNAIMLKTLKCPTIPTL